MKATNTGLFLGAFALAGVAVGALPAHAQIVNLSIYQSQYYQQTGPSTVIENTDGYTFDARLFTTNSTDVSDVSLSGPYTGSPEAMPYNGIDPVSGYTYEYNTGYLPSQSDLTTDNPSYPYGTYVVNYDGGDLGTGSVTVNYSQVAYSGDTPQFTAATYDTLQNLNTAQDNTISWNTFDTGSVADDSLIFFSIYDASDGNVVFSDTFQDSGTTSDLLPAGTLQPGTSYDADLDFSNRIDGMDADSNYTVQGFDQRTDEYFTTSAAPEPSQVGMLALMGLGLGGLLLRGRGLHRSRK